MKSLTLNTENKTTTFNTPLDIFINDTAFKIPSYAETIDFKMEDYAALPFPLFTINTINTLGWPFTSISPLIKLGKRILRKGSYRPDKIGVPFKEIPRIHVARCVDGDKFEYLELAHTHKKGIHANHVCIKHGILIWDEDEAPSGILWHEYGHVLGGVGHGLDFLRAMTKLGKTDLATPCVQLPPEVDRVLQKPQVDPPKPFTNFLDALFGVIDDINDNVYSCNV